jgi:hypothetical protein
MYEALPAFIDAIQAENDVRAIQKLLLDTLGEVLRAENVLLVRPAIYGSGVVTSYREVTRDDSQLKNIMSNELDKHKIVAFRFLTIVVLRSSRLSNDEHKFLEACVKIADNRLDIINARNTRTAILKWVINRFKYYPQRNNWNLHDLLRGTYGSITDDQRQAVLNSIYLGSEMKGLMNRIERVYELITYDLRPEFEPTLIDFLLDQVRLYFQNVRSFTSAYEFIVTEQDRLIELQVRRDWCVYMFTGLMCDLDSIYDSLAVKPDGMITLQVRQSLRLPGHAEFSVRHSGLVGRDMLPKVVHWSHVHETYLDDLPEGGVFLIQRVVQLHNGDLDVQIDEAAGVTVTIYLPLAHP